MSERQAPEPLGVAEGVASIDHAVEQTSASATADDSDVSSHEPTPLEKQPSHVSHTSHRSRLSRLSRSLRRRDSVSTDDSDPLEPLELAMTPNVGTEVEQAAREPISHAMTTTSLGSVASRLPDFEVTFSEDDPSNPRNWALWYRLWIVFSISYSTWVVVVYSTSYTAAIPGVMESFNISSEAVATLGVTTYLIGLAMGAMLLAPLSELFGRRMVYIVCIICFTLLVIPSALATSLAEILVVRFFGAVFGAALVSNGPATIVDISTEDNRALYISIMAIAPMNGPVTGPLIGGFVFEYLGWRWDSWIVIIISGAAIVFMASLKETYAPAILKAKAAKMRKEKDDDRYWCRYDERISILDLLKVNLSRPFILAATEPILWFFNIWISIVYGILYLCFVAYPIVFIEGRGWSSGISGLAFVGIGIGTMCAIGSEPLCRRLINNYPKDPETGRAPPEASARIMVIGAILTPIGQLVFSWTCLPKTIHWAIPIAFGIPFGAGNTLTFIYGSNYLAGSYGLYAASALAGNMVIRSLFGGTLPLAGSAMYKAMTPQWAGTFLGLLEVMLIPIPIVFLRYGKKIRARSRVIRQMRADMERNEAKRAKQARIIARQKAKKEEREAAAAARANGSGVVESIDIDDVESVDIERTADIDHAHEKEKRSSNEPTAAAVPSKEE
ncbi:MFS transporter [Sporothrix schenckii 1099-18]|uniref:Major facilitator superfamily (MFS) profile domain-containing protein n=2 Tax=Sporothrix schenckii TaxID=29908 RepID=U7Q4D9_SPOS1|nr:MFS transporter [Sporothrix schenckii 1099-18]ERT02723.1 hypothetical protein HMPREF1624_01024 [Sporothrix schenckii ATCC 58251]KJR79962.1 MFS transporter [Sporothrix schenckii 1099-18]